jgi:enoyl-CoA hydratase/carnithine racemase
VKEEDKMSQPDSKAQGYVRLDADGLPCGVLQPITDRRTTRFEIRDDGVAIITLDRPEKLNAFDERMIHEVRTIMWTANFDDRVKIIVITGAGRAFCSGRDINGLDYENNLPTRMYRAYVRASHEMMDDFEAIEKPVIAAVNGIAAGGGMEIAIACDFRIMSASATFLLPENQLGVIPASGACSRLIQMIGIGRLKEMVLAALPMSAQRSLDIGLATRVVPDDNFMNGVLEFCNILLQRAPLAMGMAKHIINTCQNVDTETGRILERLGQSVLIGTADNHEGMTAFREKRRPVFTNR